MEENDPNVFCFEVPGTAVGKAMRTDKTTLKRYPTPRTKEWMDRVEFYARCIFDQEPWTGPVDVELIVVRKFPSDMSNDDRGRCLRGEILPEKKPDNDNVEKAIFDAMSGVVYVDDAQVTDNTTRKRYGPKAFTRIRVERIGGPRT